MKKFYLLIACSFYFTWTGLLAQENNELSNTNKKEKKFSLKIGAGLYQPFINEDGIIFTDGINSDGVTFSGANYNPKINIGVSLITSVDYALSDNFYVGLGFNGAFVRAKFIRDAIVNNQTIDGYLKKGALENTTLLINFTYTPKGEGIKPYVKLGIGYLTQEVELGDVPLALTNNVETEIFTDYKNSGISLIPELGVRYKNIFFSVAYSASFMELTGETVDGFSSPGSITSQGLQFNFTYNLFGF